MAIDTDDLLIATIESAAKTLSLTVEPEWIPTIRANLEVSLRLARLVDEFPLPDDHEPATTFRA